MSKMASGSIGPSNFSGNTQKTCRLTVAAADYLPVVCMILDRRARPDNGAVNPGRNIEWHFASRTQRFVQV